MKCIYCGGEESKVLDSRSCEESNSIRRRRECLNCGKRYTTYETIEDVPILVVKNNQSRQVFDINKVKRGIIKACEKRPVSISQIDTMVANIEKQIHNTLDQEILSSKIGDMVMDELSKVDDVAYIRFACVYRKFTDLTHFLSFLQDYNNKQKD